MILLSDTEICASVGGALDRAPVIDTKRNSCSPEVSPPATRVATETLQVPDDDPTVINGVEAESANTATREVDEAVATVPPIIDTTPSSAMLMEPTCAAETLNAGSQIEPN